MEGRKETWLSKPIRHNDGRPINNMALRIGIFAYDWLLAFGEEEV
jgi:hypothetical protein